MPTRLGAGQWTSNTSARIRSEPLGPDKLTGCDENGLPIMLPQRAQEFEDFLVARFALRLRKASPTGSIFESYVPENQRSRVHGPDITELRRLITAAVETVFSQLAHRSDYEIELAVRLEPPARQPWFEECAAS